LGEGFAVVTSLTAPQITTLQNSATALTTRVAALEADPLTAKVPSIGDTLHFVLTGNQVIPLVAGLGVEIETVTEGLFMPSYIRVSALPWAAGWVSSQRDDVACTSKHAFTTAGGFSTGVLIRFPDHPDGTNYTISVTLRAQGVSLFLSYNPTFPGEVAVWFRNTSGTNVAIDFCFIVH